MALVVVDNGVPSVAAASSTDGLQAGEIHTLHGSESSLHGGGVPGPLAAHSRSLKSPLLLLLLPLLYSTVSLPPSPPFQ